MSSIRFTGTLVGNLGAPFSIQSTWMTAPADDVDDEGSENSQYMESEDPFSVGFDSDEREGMVNEA